MLMQQRAYTWAKKNLWNKLDAWLFKDSKGKSLEAPISYLNLGQSQLDTLFWELAARSIQGIVCGQLISEEINWSSQLW